MQTYRTTDLYIASYLKTVGRQLVDADNKNGRITFIFDNDDDAIKALVIAYTNKEGKVEPCIFVDNIKNMKSLTHNL